MDFAVTLHTDRPARPVIEFATRAEERGFACVWTFDSHILSSPPRSR